MMEAAEEVPVAEPACMLPSSDAQSSGYRPDCSRLTFSPGAIPSSHAVRSWGFGATVLVGLHISRVYLGSRPMPKGQALERMSGLALLQAKLVLAGSTPQDAGYCGPARRDHLIRHPFERLSYKPDREKG